MVNTSTLYLLNSELSPLPKKVMSSNKRSSYPDNNCAAKYGNDFSKDLNAIFPDYLNHTSPRIITQSFTPTANLALGMGKEMIMFETNTASCGGFAGISDSFGAGLWTLDYGLQMAYSNFSHALLHVGGRNDHYNVRFPSVVCTRNRLTVHPTGFHW